MGKMPYAEPYKIKMVEAINQTTKEERIKAVEEAGFNLFNLRSEHVLVDCITDSGTGSMTDHQWSAMMLGDESYAGSKSYYYLKDTIKEILGFDYVIPTHQGRAAENVLFSALVKEGDVIPGNSHFDTTKGHIEFRKAACVDCTIDEAFDPTLIHPFKGNANIQKLEETIKKHGKKIPFVIMTITCNNGGGQPVSLANLREVRALCDKYKLPLFFDSARFAENAYFIKKREEGYADKTIKEIVAETFTLADGMTMSAKKDAIVNIGGFIAMRSEELYKKCSVFTIMFEGFMSYGGMAGRDMAALAVGLDENTEFNYLDARISQVEYLGNRLKEEGIPVMEPFGGHAIYIDALRFLPHVPQLDYPAQALGVELYIEAGVRGVEIGTVLADRDPITREERVPKTELLRLAVPRRVYTNNHMEVIVWGCKKVWDRRKEIKGFEIDYEAPIMRHFTSTFKRK